MGQAQLKTEHLADAASAGQRGVGTAIIFTAALGREIQISADRQRVIHRAGAWSTEYTPNELGRWLLFYERMARNHPHPAYHADVEVLRQARDALAAD